jgi:PEP-CTERM motif
MEAAFGQVCELSGGDAAYRLYAARPQIERSTGMKYTLTALVAVVALAFSAAPAAADWNVGDPYKMHFPQLPDLTPLGVDVLATYPYPFVFPPAEPFGKILADDWKCTETGPVRDIHIWGSWLENRYPINTATGNLDPAQVRFKLSIHENLPPVAGGPDYSRPGKELWRAYFGAGDPRVVARPLTVNVDEYFWDPNPQPHGEVLGKDNVVWQYNFVLAATDPVFTQRAGQIYWLDVMADPQPGQPGTLPPLFGWKTADRFKYPDNPNGLHFEDDAVFADISAPNAPADALAWRPLKYWDGHPYAGQSMDLAFVITPEPGTWVMLVGAGLLGLAAYVRRRRNR